MQRRLFGCLLMAAMLTGAPACAGRSSKATPTPVATSSVGFTAHISLEGAVTGNEDYDIGYLYTGGPSSCAGVAARSSTSKLQVSFTLPLPRKIGTHTVAWLANVNPYRGPGTYALNFVVPLRVIFDAGTKGEKSFIKSENSHATATVNANGSGTFTFSNLEGKSGTLAGSVRWSCGA